MRSVEIKRNVLRGAAALVACALTACAVGGAVATESASPQGENGFAVAHAALVDGEGALPDCVGCHDMKAVAESTADWNGNAGMNPHSAHVPLDCGYCHTMEGDAQVMFCGTCHSKMVLPEGWAAREMIGGQSQR